MVAVFVVDSVVSGTWDGGGANGLLDVLPTALPLYICRSMGFG